MLALGIGILLFGYYLRSVFTPFLVGFFVAYILNPVINFGEKYIKNRAYCIALLCGILALLMLGAVAVLVPMVYHEVQNLPAAVFGDAYEDSDDSGTWEEGEPLTTDWNEDGRFDAGYMDAMYKVLLRTARQWAARKQKRKERLGPSSEETSEEAAPQDGVQQDAVVPKPAEGTGKPAPEEAELHEAIEELRRWIEANYVQVAQAGGKVSAWIAQRLGAALRGLLSMFNLFSALVLVPIYAIFLLYSMNDIRDAVFTHLPSKYRDRIISVLTQIHLAVSAFFRGRLMICGMLGVMITILLSLCGVRFAIVMGVVAGIASLIPFLGALLPMLLAVLFVYLDHGSLLRVLAVAASFGFAQSVEGWILTPFILGREVEIHPVTLILALFIFGELFGLFGVLMAVPLACIIKILGREFVLPELNALAKGGRR